RAVDIDGDGRNRAFLRQGVKGIDDFLRAANRKCRNENPSPACGSLPNDLRKLGARSFDGLVIPIPVRRLHYQCIRTDGGNWFPDYGEAAASDIAGKDQSFRLSPFRTVEKHRGSSQYVPGIDIARPYSRHHV